MAAFPHRGIVEATSLQTGVHIMSKLSTDPTVAKPAKAEPTVTLAAAVVTSLVTAFAESFNAARNSGTALAGFCAAALAAKLPVKPVAADVDAIVDGVAKRLAWSGTAREKASKSEARVLIAQHALLPEGLTAYKAATGVCGYHEAVRVARAIRDTGDVPTAIAGLTAEHKAAKADHDASLTRALQSYYRAMQNG